MESFVCLYCLSFEKRRVKKLRASIVQVGGCGQTESFSFEQHHCGVVLHDVSDGGGSVSLTVAVSALPSPVAARRGAVKRRSAAAAVKSRGERRCCVLCGGNERARVKRCYAHSLSPTAGEAH